MTHPPEKKSFELEGTMLWIIIVVLVVLWLFGLIGHIGGGAIHTLLVIAAIVLIYNMIGSRRGRI